MRSRSPGRRLAPVIVALLAIWAAALPASAAAAAPPSISTSFSLNAVKVGEVAQASFLITNPAANGALTGISFTDNLPAGLQVANPSGATNSCGGTVTATAGTSTISLSGGALPNDPANPTSCSISVGVQVTSAGAKDNATGPIDSNESVAGPGSNTATISGVVAPAFSKAFGADTVTLGSTSPLLFTISNQQNSVTLQSVGFSDTLPAGLEIANPSGLGISCAGSVTADSGSTSITLADATVFAGEDCTVAVNVKATSLGTKSNTSGPIAYAFESGIGEQTGTGSSASDSIDVVAPVVQQPDPGTGTGTPPPGTGTGTTPPPVVRCRVPVLKSLSLAKAKRKIKAAHCRLGKVTKPARKRTGVPLVVARSSPKAGKRLAAGAKVNLTLAYKRR